MAEIHQTIIGAYSEDEVNRRLHKAMAQLKIVCGIVLERNKLSTGQAIGMVAGVAAAMAEDCDLREEMAEIFERWIPILRSDQPVTIRADGNA